MKKFRRVLALLGIILLVSMYICCLIFALLKSEHAQTLFRMSLAATIAVPVVLYAILMFTRLAAGRQDEAADSAQKDNPEGNKTP